MRKISPKKTISSGTLAAQKSTVKRAALDFLCAALFFLFVAIVVLIVGLTFDDRWHTRMILFAVLIISAFFVGFLFFSIKRFLLVRSLNRVSTEEEEIIGFRCERVRFIAHPRTRTDSDIIAVIFVAADRQKYVYVLPHSEFECKDTRTDVRNELVGKTVEALCYKGTRCQPMLNTFSWAKHVIHYVKALA